MELKCDVCNEVFNDELILANHKELFHKKHRPSVICYAPEANIKNVIQHAQENGNQINRPSVIQFAPPARSTLSVEPLAEAFPNSIVRHYIINNNEMDLDKFLSESKQLIANTLSVELERLNFVKFGLMLNTSFINLDDELSTRGFISRHRTITLSCNTDDIIEECIQELILKVTEHESRGSSWSLFKVHSMNIRVHKQGYSNRGSSYIKLPKKIADTHSCVNVKNFGDEKCFYYAVLSKFIPNGSHAHLPGQRYVNVEHNYNFTGIQYPVSLNDVKLFEKRNPGVTVNIFGLDDFQNVYPLKVENADCREITDLLLIKSGKTSHYVYIKDFNKLVSSQVTKRNGAVTVCKRCFNFAHKPYNSGGREWLTEHLLLCSNYSPARITLPRPERAYLKFTDIKQALRVPFVIYSDFEASLTDVTLDRDVQNPASRVKYQKHEPNCFCLLVKSTLSEEHLQLYGLTSEPYVFRGDNVVKKFLDVLYYVADRINEIYSYVVPMEVLSADKLAQHNSATQCYLCECSFTEENWKTADHDHLTSVFRGSCCNTCNLNYILPNFIPVILHNLSRYDAHFIIPELGRDDKPIDVIASTNENFISFSKKVNDRLTLRFIDSFRFLPSALDILVKNLEPQDFKETSRVVPADKMHLVQRKQLYPYDYVVDASKFSDTALPPPECFYNKLNETHVDMEDYRHAQTVWEQFQFENLGAYTEFYVKIDVTLLCDIFEKFRDTCMLSYGLDPVHNYTSPGISWMSMMKHTKVNLELLTDIDQILFVEQSIRGGLTQCMRKHVVANNKYVPNYNENEESTYLTYLDFNSLYSWAMSQPLPFGNFKWIDANELGDILNLPRNGDVGFIMEVDLIYPDRLHDLHIDLPYLPKSEIPPHSKYPKLMTTLEDKHKYVAHYWTIQDAIKAGLILTGIHRVLQFSQSCWLKSYIELNIEKRRLAHNKFDQGFYKLMNNSVFGKTLQNNRRHLNIKLVTNEKQMLKLTRKSNFKTSNIINNNLVMVSMHQTSIKMNRPMYVGFSILDISKSLVYDFYHNKMVPYFGRDRIFLNYIDTDSYLLSVRTHDLYQELKSFPHRDEFDFSNYPSNHPNFDKCNTNVLGKLKDETKGDPIQEFIGLRPKLYAIKTLRENGQSETIKKSKGIKKLYVEKNIIFDHYLKCLQEGRTYTAKFNTIRSFNHSIYSITETKKSLSSHDDKRVFNGVNSVPYGHYSLREIAD